MTSLELRNGGTHMNSENVRCRGICTSILCGTHSTSSRTMSRARLQQCQNREMRNEDKFMALNQHQITTVFHRLKMWKIWENSKLDIRFDRFFLRCPRMELGENLWKLRLIACSPFFTNDACHWSTVKIWENSSATPNQRITLIECLKTEQGENVEKLHHTNILWWSKENVWRGKSVKEKVRENLPNYPRVVWRRENYENMKIVEIILNFEFDAILVDIYFPLQVRESSEVGIHELELESCECDNLKIMKTWNSWNSWKRCWDTVHYVE